MCRIDAPFGNRSLDEKKDPVERFLQALDEFEIQDNSRALLIQHFSENWTDVFYSSSNLEEALTTANEQNSEPEKCVALAFFQNINIRFRLQPFRTDDSYRESALFKFLTDVANTYFPTSPYSFYKAGIERHFSSYAWFVRNHYGDELFFTKEFFNDDAFCSLNGNERLHILWDCLYFIAPPFDSLRYHSDDSTLFKGLLSLASSKDDSSSPCEHAQSIQLGLEFLQTWLKHDAEMGRISCDLSSFFWGTPWERLESLVWQKDFDDEEVKRSLTKWLNNTKQELEKVLILSFKLDNASGPELEQWANQVDRYFNHISHDFYSEFDWETQRHGELDIRRNSELEALCSQLSSQQLETWIGWSIQQDFDRILGDKQRAPELSSSSEKWVCETFFATWKDLFLANMNELEIEKQLRILSAHVPARRGVSSEFYSACSEWWRELFRGLPETVNFPKRLIPEWTTTAIRCLHGENLTPYIDKSIGILRGEVSMSDETETPLDYSDLLRVLLERLDKVQPSKSFRHRMLLMRSYSSSFADEAISLRDRSFNTSTNQWYEPISDLAKKLFDNDEVINLGEAPENYEKKLSQPYIACTHELAEFCLSRLRLRKGEKARDKQYAVEQIVERSSVWRQGYLKALTELGVDLNGKVHKAVYFIKQSDPDPDVRAIANECYKAVRRNTKKNSTIADLKRGIIAAEWWLLICQRQNLGMTINHEGALKTRRTLMRNP
ncbi:hypothetical protein C9980_04085 [Vibrio mediterranei]|uniref:hypothetical protein n=1 Tax=Vibrio mediterranei TaxID=689 RepID=UPI000D17FDB5|nr:hypothetical protein [Vibrio mediterranei]PTC05931.1 hypothetical protein C9980_04085 [Vibrio mediterranei]